MSLAISLILVVVRAGPRVSPDSAVGKSHCSSAKLILAALRISSSLSSLNSPTLLSRRFRRTTSSASMSISRSSFAARTRIDASSLETKFENAVLVWPRFSGRDCNCTVVWFLIALVGRCLVRFTLLKGLNDIANQVNSGE